MSNNSTNSKRKRVIRISILVIIIIIILLLLKCCGKRKDEDTITPIAQTPEQSILQRMKDDESYLFSLYDSPNICEKDWVKDYRKIGYTFTNYQHEYTGNNQEIKDLLLDYVDYGKQIEEIAISIDKSNYEEGIEQLEELIETAKENEKELQRLYDQEFKK